MLNTEPILEEVFSAEEKSAYCCEVFFKESDIHKLMHL